MTNKEILMKIAEEKYHDLEILTYEEIVQNYVCGEGLNSIEDFCGYDMDEDEVAFWVPDMEPLFRFAKKDEDISDDDANDILMRWGEDDVFFPELRESYVD